VKTPRIKFGQETEVTEKMLIGFPLSASLSCRADVSYYCTSKSEIPDKKISREVYPAFKCANESKRRKKRQQECKINN